MRTQITEAMLEAGLEAAAEWESRFEPRENLVAAVYEAMDAVRTRIDEPVLVAGVVKDVLAKAFAPHEIARVDVCRPQESEKDFGIEVWLHDEPVNLPSEMLNSAVRLVRPRMLDLGITGFPYFHFMQLGDEPVE